MITNTLRLTASKTLYRGFELSRFGHELRVSFALNSPNVTAHKMNYLKRFKGFNYKADLKAWCTTDGKLAEEFLSALTSGDAEKWMTERRAEQEKRLLSSRTADSTRDIPKPDPEEYLPYQRGGIGFVADLFEDGKPGVLIGDEMGLGKTIQAIGASNLLGLRKVLVVCPGTPRGNWRKEFKKWTTLGLRVGIVSSDFFPPTDVVIISYDIVHRWEKDLKRIRWDLVIADEAHRLKNPSARRSQVVLGVGGAKPRPAIKGKLLLALTGTPILNRPEEIFSILHWVAPDDFPSRRAFEGRYAEKTLKKLGDRERLDRLNELQELLRRTCMIRRLKADVLSELPPKVRQVIEIQGGIEALRAIAEERKVLAEQKDIITSLKEAVAKAKTSTDDGAYRSAVRNLRAGAAGAITELSRIRKATAIAKIPYVISHVDQALEELSGKVIIFAHHQEVVEEFLEHYGEKAVAIYGKTPRKPEIREAIQDQFQTDDSVRVFIGSFGAAGVAITLTAASTVVFAELDWVPGNVLQAEDRAHRYGQKDSVLVQHLVLQDSLDSVIANRIVEKADMIDAALDKDAAEIVGARETSLLDELLGIESKTLDSA